MEKRNKKKLFAIIGGSVLAFVLTIALSVSITLAYFGATSVDTTGDKITMADKLDFKTGAAVAAAATATLDDLLPGQPAQSVELTATVAGSGTSYFLRFKMDHDYTGDADVITITAPQTIAGATSLKLSTKSTDGYYYVVDADGTTPLALTTANDTTYTATMTVQVPSTVTNAQHFAGEITVTGEMGIVQAQYLEGTVTTVAGLEDAWPTFTA